MRAKKRKSDGVSIVIPNWNGEDLLKQGIPPLKKAIKNLKIPAQKIFGKNLKDLKGLELIRIKLKKRDEEIKQKEPELNRKNKEIVRLNTQINNLKQILDNIISAKTFKVWQAYCKLRSKILSKRK